MASSPWTKHFPIYFAVLVIVALVGFIMVLFTKNMTQFLGVVLVFIPVILGIIMDITRPRSTL